MNLNFEMNPDPKMTLDPQHPKLQLIHEQVQELAQSCQGDSLQILALLRLLESLHQEIRDTLFQEALPDNRQALYSLLKDIEASGGWPYIHRMKLQGLLQRLSAGEDGEFVLSELATLPNQPASDRTMSDRRRD